MSGVGKLVNKINSNHKIRIGEIMIDENLNVLILEQIYIDNSSKLVKGYRYKCNKCGCIGEFTESYLLSGNVYCPICCGRQKTIILKPNNIVAKPNTHWMIKYFQGGYDEAKLYTYRSDKIVEFKCPDCGEIRKKKVNELYSFHSIGCKCGDGVSYPNKFIYAILNQLNIDYSHEVNFLWASNKFYDVYIENIQLIIENHGKQHYSKNGFHTFGGRTLEEEQANDKYKKESALQNGIKYYIELDCRKSELNWIKDSVMKSQLPNLLHFKEEDIDWLECERYATKNIVKEVCDYKKENPFMSIKELIIKFHSSESTIRKYLKSGNELGWCVYIPKKPNKEQVFTVKSKPSRKRVLCIEKDIVFFGVREVAEKGIEIFNEEIRSEGVRKCCTGEKNSYKGYHFKFITNEEYKNRMYQQINNPPLSA